MDTDDYSKFSNEELILIDVLVRLVESPLIIPTIPAFGGPRRPPPILEVWDRECFTVPEERVNWDISMAEPTNMQVDDGIQFGAIGITQEFDIWYTATVERVDDYLPRAPTVVEVKLMGYRPAERIVESWFFGKFLLQNVHLVTDGNALQVIRQRVESYFAPEDE